MRVAIDLMSVRSWGPKNYTAGLLPALASLDPSSQFLVFLRPEVARLVEELVPANVEIRVVRTGVAGRLLWEQTVLPFTLLGWRADVLFAAFDIAPVLSPCPVLLAVRNPSAALMRGGFATTAGQSVAAQVHRVVSYICCKRARLVFYPTEFAATLLGTLMKVPEHKRRVVHHGTDRDYFAIARQAESVLEHYGLEEHKYVLYVSGFYPYKHPEVLIDAFGEFVRAPENETFKLVLVGADLLIAKTKRVAEERLREQVVSLGLDAKVVFPGQVPREHLAVLYQNAAAFVLPTVMETFGLPFVEAMASSAPVICADMPFAREICGDAALYFPAGDSAMLAAHLASVAHGGSQARRMAEAGRQRSKAFSWRREAEGTLDLLTEVVLGRADSAS